MSRVASQTKLREERMREIYLRNKERELMREREIEAREKEARYSNGHLFTSLTVSGTMLCYACNKSITAKEALSCMTCTATIHNRCRDTLPNCAKVKQRQQKTALTRSNSALNNVTLRTRTAGIQQRPSSAIYHSDSRRQTLLGSRPARSGLSLSKSISTNNILGSLTDDSPLGLSRILSQSTDSLSFRTRAISMESLNEDGDNFYRSVLEELQLEGEEFQADSWSMAVDSHYLQMHRKNVIKRQDVIYELIQTEVHHMRTLRIMERIFQQGILEELQLDPISVQVLFPCLEQLISIHSHFLKQLLSRRKSCLQNDSSCNFIINRLGDLLLEQFSGQCAIDMKKTYAEYCSRHLKAVKLYKELMARDKRFQNFVRRVTREPWLRCHGFQECILLVTQRISKYPVLIQRILDNTSDDEEEELCLTQVLSSVRELLSDIDQQIEVLEKTQRMQEIQSKLDQRAEVRVRDGGLFRPGELLRRKLVHEGTMFWKTSGSRSKEVHVLLMNDILVFLLEKDHRYLFPCLGKPPVLSLQNLIVRDIANQERGMYLISDSSPPEMYEFHAVSKEDKKVWICHILQSVSKYAFSSTFEAIQRDKQCLTHNCGFRCPSREEFPIIETEQKAYLRRLKADIQQKDRELLDLLQTRVMLFCELARMANGHEDLQPPVTRYLFRADTPQAPQAEKLLLNATAEVDRLSELLLGPSGEDVCHNHMDSSKTRNTDVILNGAPESLRDEVCQRLMDLGMQLHALQAAVIKQDSILELLLPTAAGGSSLSREGSCWDINVGATIGELTLLQRQHSLLQDELLRLRDAETRFKDSERARSKLELQVQQLKSGSVNHASCADHQPLDQSLSPQCVSDVEVDVISEDDEGTTSERTSDFQEEM
ncbi:rho guanine nucleotide exchange factor 2 [Synchiropus picturatus]